MRNRRTKIRFPIFADFEIAVICTHDLVKTGKRLKEKLEHAEAAYVYKKERPGYGWLIFGPNPTPELIAHEASHAVRDLFKFAGVGNDNEAFAYHLGHVVRRLHRFLKVK